MNNRSNYALSKRFFSQRNSLPATLATPRILCVSVLAALSTAVADDSSSEREFVRRPYVGIGVGVTNLDPESRTPSLTVGDGQDAGGTLFLGYDFTPHFSVEAYYSDLGTAGIDFLGEEVGGVDYQVFGVSVLGYFANSRNQEDYADACATCDDEGLYRREGLSPFLRLGVGAMQNDSELDYERDHDVHLTVGAGLEYGWSNGVALRGEIVSYDWDAQYAGLSIIKRFGDPAPRNRAAALAPAAVPAVVPAVVPKTRSIGDADVTERPLDFPVPTFPFGKFGVTPEASLKLDALAAQMDGERSLNILITGHTDSVGSEAFNQTLSIKRATAVKAYLIKRGIAAERMSIEGSGELDPVETNSTDAGRAANRRVQISSN